MSTQATDPAAGRYVDANGLHIYYEEYGAGEPLILIHGGTGVGQMWQPHVRFLAERYRVLTPDSRGHGHTANPTGQFSYRMMADDMAAFAEALDLRKPLVCGYSDGGQIALELGMRYPDLARALVIGAAWFKWSEYYARGLQATGCSGPGAWDGARLRQVAPWFADLVQSWHAPLGDDYWQTLLNQIATLFWTPLHYTPSDFARITAPALILSGDRDESIPLEQQLELYHLIPGAELAILPGADHVGGFYRVDLFVRIVSNFFERHRAPIEVEQASRPAEQDADAP